MDALTALAAVSVTAIVVTRFNERRSHWYTLAFAFACVLAAAYAFLSGAWLFGILATLLYLLGMRRWVDRQGGA